MESARNNSCDILRATLTKAPTPLRARRNTALAVSLANRVISCSPLCTKCGMHPISSLKAVVRALCCNRCPDHGPWCTSHAAQEFGDENGLAVKSDEHIVSLNKPQSRAQPGNKKCTLVEVSDTQSTLRAPSTMAEETLEKQMFLEGSAASIAQRRKSLKLPLLESLQLQAMENLGEEPVLRKSSDSEIFNWASLAESGEDPCSHEASSAEVVLPSVRRVCASLVAMGEAASKDSADEHAWLDSNMLANFVELDGNAPQRELKGKERAAKNRRGIADCTGEKGEVEAQRKRTDLVDTRNNKDKKQCNKRDRGNQQKAKLASLTMPSKATVRQRKRALPHAPIELMLPRLKRSRDVETVSSETCAEASQQVIY